LTAFYHSQAINASEALRIPVSYEYKDFIYNALQINFELIHFYLDAYQKENGHQPPCFSQEVLAVLKQYHWPGNIRELFNLLERIANLYEGGEVTLLDLPPHIYASPLRRLAPDHNNLKNLLDSVEKELIERALSETGGNKRQAAARLGIHRITLYEKLKRLKIRPGSSAGRAGER
jgi:DNA-binding NtrC family response regulator